MQRAGIESRDPRTRWNWVGYILQGQVGQKWGKKPATAGLQQHTAAVRWSGSHLFWRLPWRRVKEHRGMRNCRRSPQRRGPRKARRLWCLGRRASPCSQSSSCRSEPPSSFPRKMLLRSQSRWHGPLQDATLFPASDLLSSSPVLPPPMYSTICR